MPGLSTGIGSWPGTDIAAATRLTFGEFAELPYLPELPDRGAAAGMIGRATAICSGLDFDLQPAGWRLTDGSGADHRRAAALLRQDLDILEEVAQGWDGPVKVAVTGPITLAATVEKPRGDKVLSDHGARRELAQALAEGTASLFDELARRLPQIQPVLQVDEPMLPQVLGGQVATASGFGRHRRVDFPEIFAALEALATAGLRHGRRPHPDTSGFGSTGLGDSGLGQSGLGESGLGGSGFASSLAESGMRGSASQRPGTEHPGDSAGSANHFLSWSTVLHCCAPGLPVAGVLDAGFEAVSLPIDTLTGADPARRATLDAVAAAIDGGHHLLLGVADTAAVDSVQPHDVLARRALDLLRPLELGPVLADSLTLTPSCGLAGWSPSAALQQARAVRRAAGIVADELLR